MLLGCPRSFASHAVGLHPSCRLRPAMCCVLTLRSGVHEMVRGLAVAGTGQGKVALGGRFVPAKMQNFQLLKILNLLTMAPRKYQ